MFNNKRKLVINSIGIILLVIMLSFAYFRYSRYRTGPEISSINMEKFMTIDKASLSIDGLITNTQSLTINQQIITLQDKKSFHKILVFSPGINIIEIGLTDAFGKEKVYIYNVFYKTEKIPFIKTLQEARELAETLLEEEINNNH